MKQILLKTCSHLLLANAICVMSIVLISTPSFAACLPLQFKLTDADNIVADGTVDTDEWTDADAKADQFGNGAFYTMSHENYAVGSGSYTGTFNFLLHNIEQLTVDNDWDYNFFDYFKPKPDDSDCPNPLLTIYVFDDVDSSDDSWFGPSGLQSLIGGTSFDDRGFLVYNYEESDYVHWLPGNTGPEDGGYVWDDYYGVYAAGGFNNSAYEKGLNLAVNNDNELYEVIYNLPVCEIVGHDPYIDDIVTPPVDYFIIPEPGTLVLLALGGLALLRKRRS
jgi:hypothetical protein